eukprot:907548-Rhodomonas_salina.2
MRCGKGTRDAGQECLLQRRRRQRGPSWQRATPRPSTWTERGARACTWRRWARRTPPKAAGPRSLLAPGSQGPGASAHAAARRAPPARCSCSWPPATQATWTGPLSHRTRHVTSGHRTPRGVEWG